MSLGDSQDSAALAELHNLVALLDRAHDAIPALPENAELLRDLTEKSSLVRIAISRAEDRGVKMPEPRVIN
jgi:hypothetical protein